MVVGGSLLLVSALNIFISYTFLNSALENEMAEVDATAANIISNQLSSVVEMVNQIASDSNIQDIDDSSAVRSKIIVAMKTYDIYPALYAVNMSAECINDPDKDFSENEYYQNTSKTGEISISPVYYSDEFQKTVIEIYTPIITNDLHKIRVGVFCAVVDIKVFSDVVGQITIGESGYAMVLDSHGTVIGHPNPDVIDQRINYITMAQSNYAFSSIAEVLKNAISGNDQQAESGEQDTEAGIEARSGFGQAVLDGVNKFLYYTPIEDTDGWSCVLVATPSEHTGKIYLSVIISATVAIICFVISIIVILGIIKRMILPVTKCSERLIQLSEGNLHQEPFNTEGMDNEIGELGNSTNLISERLNAIIGDIDKLLTAFGEGDLSFRPADVYLGDFSPLRDSYARIQLSLNTAMDNIKRAGREVSAGSEQVSDAAGNMSYGAAKQAASVQQLSASITEIADKVNKNAERANNAADSSGRAKMLVASGNEQMHLLLEAMNQIQESSSRIASITRTIEDISFQTNILALNAAVEAARAGEAGKGFAVVADEVRLLASKVAGAASDTTELIGNSIKSVENGTGLAVKTSHTLENIVKATENITKLVTDISDASNEQAESLRQITAGVDQISSVVQTNTAVGEECAASAQQLSSQAVILEKMVGMFKLDRELLDRQNGGSSYKENIPFEQPDETVDEAVDKTADESIEAVDENAAAPLADESAPVDVSETAVEPISEPVEQEPEEPVPTDDFGVPIPSVEDFPESAPVAEQPTQEITESAPVAEQPAQELTESVPTVEQSAQDITESVPVAEQPAQELTESVPTVEQSAQDITESVPVAEQPAQEITESVPVAEQPVHTKQPEQPGIPTAEDFAEAAVVREKTAPIEKPAQVEQPAPIERPAPIEPVKQKEQEPKEKPGAFNEGFGWESSYFGAADDIKDFKEDPDDKY